MTKYKLLTDLQLWDLLKSGDRHAYAEIYERYFSVLYLHARNRLKDVEEAEDVVQELFLDLWSSSESTVIRSSVQSYLFTSIRNRILNFIAHKSHQEKYKVVTASTCNFESITDHLVRERMLRKLIEQEIEALPPKMKKVFFMSRREHMTYLEIAEKLNITEQSVRSHVKNALKVLRVKLGVLFYILLFFSK
ncbi:MAG: RNA polymerase sigma-70 factor [Bacteroidota bacterium]